MPLASANAWNQIKSSVDANIVLCGYLRFILLCRYEATIPIEIGRVGEVGPGDGIIIIMNCQ